LQNALVYIYTVFHSLRQRQLLKVLQPMHYFNQIPPHTQEVTNSFTSQKVANAITEY